MISKILSVFVVLVGLGFALPSYAETSVGSLTGSTALYSGGSACVPANPTTNCVYEIGQMIEVPTDNTLNTISIKMFSNQPAPADVSLLIYADDTGNALPDLDHLLAVSDAIDGSTIPPMGSADYVDFTFTSNNAFTPGAFIWAILRYNDTTTGNSMYIGAYANEANSYADGRAAYRATFASDVWTALTATDLNFEATFDYIDPREEPHARFVNPSVSTAYDPLHPFLKFSVRDDVYMDEWDDMQDMEFQVQVYEESTLLDTQYLPAVQYYGPGLPHDFYHSEYTDWEFIFIPGVYVISVRSCYDGFSCGAWYDLNITVYSENGLITNNDDDDDGVPDEVEEIFGSEDEDPFTLGTFLDDYPDFAGNCELIDFDWNPFDNIACSWEWLKYAFWPSSQALGHALYEPFEAVTSRWPLAYITVPVSSFVSGLSVASTCPFPDFGGDEVMGNTTAVVSPCTYITSMNLEDKVENSPYLRGSFLMFVWILFGGLWFTMAKRFLKV